MSEQYWLVAETKPNEKILTQLRKLTNKLSKEEVAELTEVVAYYKSKLKTLELYRTEGPSQFTEAKKCEVYFRKLTEQYGK